MCCILTGSNSVNVFLVLGLPWVISVMYGVVKNKPFVLNTANLVESVVIFTIVGTTCIVLLLLRSRVSQLFTINVFFWVIFSCDNFYSLSNTVLHTSGCTLCKYIAQSYVYIRVMISLGARL